MDDFIGVNAIYDTALKGHKLERSTVEVVGLPKGVLLEIERIAVKRAICQITVDELKQLDDNLESTKLLIRAVSK
jgi:hypothetical protein